MSRLQRGVQKVCFLVIVFCVVVLAVTVGGCAGAAPRPKAAELPRVPEPTILAPSRPRTAHKPAGMTNPNDDFILGDKITPPQGCLDLRARGGNC